MTAAIPVYPYAIHVLHVKVLSSEEHAVSPRNPTYIGPDGRGFHGTVTVGSRGQVALPAQARRNVGLEPGDQLIVLSDPAEGLALIPLARLLERAPADDPLAMLVRGAIRPTAPCAASGTASTAAGETGPEPTPPPTPTSGKE